MWSGWGVGVGVDWLGRGCGLVGVGGCTSESREDMWKLGELIVSRYIAESVTADAGNFGHVAFVNCVQIDINNVAMSL